MWDAEHRIPSDDSSLTGAPGGRRAARVRRWLPRALAVLAAALGVVRPCGAISYYVSPTGSDSSDGSAPGTAFRTIQKAVDLAQPGDTVNLTSGTYLQDVVSKRNGTANGRITITGPATAIVKGGGADRIIEINHDHITLDGFTIDGLWGNPSAASGYRDKTLYVLGKEPRAGVDHLHITKMTILRSGGECIRLRYFATNAEIDHNTITHCGIIDFLFAGGGKNGEGIYIGTAPEQRADGKNPTTDPDVSQDNWVHNNQLSTFGNECVDIKEAATANIVENNDCSRQMDPNSGGMDSRGSGNVFRNNLIHDNVGVGVRLGGDTTTDGIDNAVYGNDIHDSQSGGIKFQRSPQGQICANRMVNNPGGNAVGTFGSNFNPVVPCTGGTGTDTQAPTAPTGLNAAGRSETSVFLQWTASTDNVGVVGYDIERDGSLVSVVAGVQYNDTGLAPGTTYRYAVQALDAAGNASPFSAPITIVTNPSDSSSLIRYPVADAYVRDGSYATMNFGTLRQLFVKTNRTGYHREAFVKFSLSGVTGSSAVILHLNAAASRTHTMNTGVYAVADDGWTESGIRWNNMPALGELLATVKVKRTSYRTYHVDVTTYVQSAVAAGRGFVSFGLRNLALSTTVAKIHSRESISKKPWLEIVPN